MSNREPLYSSQYELQVLQDDGRTYFPIPWADRVLHGIRSWRKVRKDKDRPLVVRRQRTNPRSQDAHSSMSREAAVRAYLDWARPRINTVTVYMGDERAFERASGCGFTVRSVPRHEFQGPVVEEKESTA